MAKKKKLSLTKLVVLVTIIAFLLTAILPLFVSAKDDEPLSLHDKQAMLSDLNKQKSSIAEKLKEARLKEQYARSKLNEIQSKLSRAQSQLNVNKKHLDSTKSAWQKTKDRLEELKDQRAFLEMEARDRIVSIYQQQRVRLIDGLLNSASVTDFLDHLYYQKRVIDYDHQVLAALIDQSENIKKYNDTLQQEANKITQITRQLQSVQNEVASQKTAQSKVLNKLQNERQVYESAERQLEKESITLIYKISKLSGEKLDNPDATGNFIYPINARITSPFGPRRHPIFGINSMHSGIDLAGPSGAKIKASEGGLVIYAGWYGGYGKVVILDHSKSYSTLYAHMDKIKVNVGEKVKQGAILGFEGATGYATGPHLHFEIRTKGRPQNPMYYLTES